jgi:hypothetical protein
MARVSAGDHPELQSTTFPSSKHSAPGPGIHTRSNGTQDSRRIEAHVGDGIGCQLNHRGQDVLRQGLAVHSFHYRLKGGHGNPGAGETTITRSMRTGAFTTTYTDGKEAGEACQIAWLGGHLHQVRHHGFLCPG